MNSDTGNTPSLVRPSPLSMRLKHILDAGVSAEGALRIEFDGERTAGEILRTALARFGIRRPRIGKGESQEKEREGKEGKRTGIFYAQ